MFALARQMSVTAKSRARVAASQPAWEGCTGGLSRPAGVASCRQGQRKNIAQATLIFTVRAKARLQERLRRKSRRAEIKTEALAAGEGWSLEVIQGADFMNFCEIPQKGAVPRTTTEPTLLVKACPCHHQDLIMVGHVWAPSEDPPLPALACLEIHLQQKHILLRVCIPARRGFSFLFRHLLPKKLYLSP